MKQFFFILTFSIFSSLLCKTLKELNAGGPLDHPGDPRHL